MDAVHASLSRLDTDYIDLYQIHRWDPNTPLEETLRALDDLVRSGKVRYIGASNFSAWQLVQGLAVSERVGLERFVSMQPHYHMFERGIEGELIPACQYHNIGILPYFPLAGGFLTGKYKQDQPPPPGSRGETSEYLKRYQTAENFQKLEQLAEFASLRSHSLTELAHAWLLGQPQISSVISGATRVEHVEKNVQAFQWTLTEEELAEVGVILGEATSFG
jgi:aryl-alcohol dehydrogenase-like predicted oxidoreductase